MSFGNSIATFKKQIEQNETISAFREMQSFSHCYPYMNRNVLIRNLGDAWELFCEKKEMIRKQAHKKVLTLQADNKVDPVVLSAAISVRDEAIDACTKSNIGLYEIRVLKSLGMDSIK